MPKGLQYFFPHPYFFSRSCPHIQILKVSPVCTCFECLHCCPQVRTCKIIQGFFFGQRPSACHCHVMKYASPRDVALLGMQFSVSKERLHNSIIVKDLSQCKVCFLSLTQCPAVPTSTQFSEISLLYVVFKMFILVLFVYLLSNFIGDCGSVVHQVSLWYNAAFPPSFIFFVKFHLLSLPLL